MKNVFLSILLIGFMFSMSLMAQEEGSSCGKTDDKKAEKLFDKGIDAARSGDFKEAIMLIDEAIERDPNYGEAYLTIADIFLSKRVNNPAGAEKYYLKYIEVCPDSDPYPYLFLAKNRFYEEKFDKAVEYLEKFLANPDKIKSTEDYDGAESLLKFARISSELYTNPVPFDPKVVPGISTKEDEVLPILSPDNEKAFFTRRTYVKNLGDISARLVERFMVSNQTEAGYDEGEPMPKPFNQGGDFNQGAVSVSLDNKELYLTICKKEQVKKEYPPGSGKMIPVYVDNCDIYVSDYVNGKWTEPENLGPKVNGKETWESQPAIGADGRTLYFARLGPGNVGWDEDKPETYTTDIWMTEKQSDGSWGEPINLGEPVNTRGNDKSPFMHCDSKTLYFVSDGHHGVGRYDIFFSKSDNNGNWLEPKNIGYPINSKDDELSFFVSTDGKQAYFSSANRPDGVGGMDLFTFKLYEEARPEEVIFIKGEVKDEKGEVPKDLKLELKDVESNEVTEIEVDSTDGKYAHVITVDKSENKDFILTAKKKGAAFIAQYISSKPTNEKEDEKANQPAEALAADETKGPIKHVSPTKVEGSEDLLPIKKSPVVRNLSMEVKPIKIGSSHKIDDIYFGVDSWDLTQPSMRMLDEFIEFMKENPSLKVAIHGHTDNVGDDNENMVLSRERAKAVYAYLVLNGVAENRLTHQGFGETKPIASNDSPEGRARNRRTEFVILSK